MSVFDWAAVGLLLVVLPVSAVVQARALRGVTLARLPAYASSAATLVVLGVLCTLLGVWQRGPRAMGFVALTPGLTVGWTAVVVVTGLGLMLGFKILGDALRMRESETLLMLLPRTRAERFAFAGLSVLAGLGEEIVFRGYALSAVAGMTGPVAAGVVTSLAFGVLHAYQGLFGVARTAVLGGVLAWGFLAAGSLWPVVAAHVVLDLLGGLVLADRLMATEAVPPRETEGPRGVR